MHDFRNFHRWWRPHKKLFQKPPSFRPSLGGNRASHLLIRRLNRLNRIRRCEVQYPPVRGFVIKKKFSPSNQMEEINAIFWLPMVIYFFGCHTDAENEILNGVRTARRTRVPLMIISMLLSLCIFPLCSFLISFPFLKLFPFFFVRMSRESHQFLPPVPRGNA